jgi:hypothetical protein
MDRDSSRQNPAPTDHWYKPNDSHDGPAEAGQHQNSPAEDESPLLHPDEYGMTANQWQVTPGKSDSISWSASEFIAHEKSFGWFALLFLATVSLAASVLLLTRDKISTVVIVLVGIVFGILAARKPKTIAYKVDNSGLNVGEHHYVYGQFRSFAIVDEDAFSSVVFMPMRRFMPLITVYYDPKDEDKIVSILSQWLPLETHRLDFIDNFMRRIRF